jgi:hypothetical protein
MSAKLTYSVGTPLPENVIEFKLYGDPKLKEDACDKVVEAEVLAARLLKAVEYLYSGLVVSKDTKRKVFLISTHTGEDIAYVRYE